MSVVDRPSENRFEALMSELGALIALALLIIAVAVVAASMPELQAGLGQLPTHVQGATNASPTSHITWLEATGGS